MSTIEERLQMKRVPIDKWSSREQLCLASAVVRSGDQNWMSVSRALKPFAEQNRPPDWFSQKNCAAQYNLLLETVETPKRKKRVSGNEVSPIVTPGEAIVQNLTQKRKEELTVIVAEERKQLLQLQEEMELIRSGKATDEQIEAWAEEMVAFEKQKEQDAVEYSNWLKRREQRKLEMERVFRPGSTFIQRKHSLEDEPMIKQEIEDGANQDTKPVLSPLLTSLLKTPTQAPPPLHSSSPSLTSPTIASLLNSSASVPVSPGIQQLVSIAISQEPNSSAALKEKETGSEESTKVTVKEEPQEQAEKKEEIKVEEEDISPAVEESAESVPVSGAENQEKAVENSSETVAEKGSSSTTQGEEESPCDVEIKEEKVSPETVQEEEEEEEEEDQEDEQQKTEAKKTEKEKDVYDFDNEKSAGSAEEEKDEANSSESEPTKGPEAVTEKPEKKKEDAQKLQPGSVEIVEILVEDEDSDKEVSNKMSEVIHNSVRDKSAEQQPAAAEPKKDTSVYDEYDFDEKKSEDVKPVEIDIGAPESSAQKTFPEYTEACFDDMQIEVTKLDKSGKAKRDYSRKKIKEEKDIDILSAVEKAARSVHAEENEVTEETGSDSDKKSDKITKIKQEERSNSPWTEEDETPFGMKTRRRYSTPATPVDSVPNSPASSGFDVDDREYRTWKKSVMLVYSRLAAHKYASLFLKPITDDQAPGYHDVIYRPMDLQTIRKNIENGSIRTTIDFQREVLLMFSNAIMYNKTNTPVYNKARQLQQEGLQQIQILLQAQTQETPARRETRTSESGLKRKRLQDEFTSRNKKRRDD